MAAWNAVVSLVYLCTGKLGLMVDPVGGFATLVWPPTGISLATLLLLGYRLLPGVLVGSLVLNFWMGAPVFAAFGMALGNTAEAFLGSWAMCSTRRS